MELTKAVEKFITYLKINRNSSPKTIEQYEFHLFKFLAYLNPEIEKKLDHRLVFITSPNNPTEIRKKNEQKKILQELVDWDLKDIDIELINNFRFSLNEKNIKTLNIKTINAYMITLRAFFKYIKKIQED
jgi:site-specific recombinase XerD